MKNTGQQDNVYNTRIRAYKQRRDAGKMVCGIIQNVARNANVRRTSEITFPRKTEFLYWGWSFGAKKENHTDANSMVAESAVLLCSD
jgi:hypothetical protein